MDAIKSCVTEIVRELLNPWNYVAAAVIGVLIHLLQGVSPLTSPVPYIVPVFVQIFSKATIKFRRRQDDLLLSLPKERHDPAMVIDSFGKIIASDDRTKEFLRLENCGCIRSFLNVTDQQFKDIVQGSDRLTVFEDIYSPHTRRFYEIHIKQAERYSKYRVLWMNDVTRIHFLNKKMESLHQFTENFSFNQDNTTVMNDPLPQLAGLILDSGYGAVFIVRSVEDEMSVGVVYKRSGSKIAASNRINILESSRVPVFLSRNTKSVFSAHKQDVSGQFHREFPFLPEVEEFVGQAIENFINYHQGEISLIAFNYRERITRQAEAAFEVMVSTAGMVSSLFEFAKTADTRIVQSITGLCAAAEFSDEITGMHIIRVNRYSLLTAKHMGFDDVFCRRIGQIAAIHDIGKVAIPHIIKLERRLTPKEIAIMQTHTVIGAQILQKMIHSGGHPDERLIMGTAIALNHHQLWNGKGYPGLMDSNGAHIRLSAKQPLDYKTLRPLKGDEIPLEALIVSLADKYDALRSKRYYKPELGHRKVCELIEKDDRTGYTGAESFGERIFQIFRDHHSDFAAVFDELKE